MFYSHEILTSRKYGVATIWLVATLGHKSALKKVDRRAINNVNVPKACEIIIEPEAPMALRLQSNLLFGVTAVYNQQCGYVLTDVQSLQNNMRHMLRSVQSADNELDPTAGRTKPENLLLPDDPNFLPDMGFGNLSLDLDLDLEETTGISSSDRSRLHSPHDSLSSHTSLDSIPGIRLPSGGSSGIGGDYGGLGGFGFGGDDSSQGGRLSHHGSNALYRVREDEGFLPQPDFDFDIYGNIIGLDQPAAAVTPDRERDRMSPTGSYASAMERPDQGQDRADAAQQQDQAFNQEDDVGYRMDDDDTQLPDADEVPRSSPRVQSVNRLANDQQEGEEDELADDEASSDYVTAKIKRKPSAAKPLPVDAKGTELSSSLVRAWNCDYLKTMKEQSQANMNSKSTALAKKNAWYYVWGSGIADIGSSLRGLNIPGPLDAFYGDQLRNLVLGIQPILPQKRDRASLEADDEDEAEAARRVRQRTDSSQLGHGRGLAEDDEGMAYGMDDEEERPPEAGRTAPTPLADDPSSIMPWNMSVSQRSSLLPGARRGLHSRAGSATSLQQLIGANRRLASASPLLGRGSMLPSQHPDSLGPLALGAGGPSSASGGFAGMDDFGYVGADEEYALPPSAIGADTQAHPDFELHGPSAKVDTQTAAQSQWIRQTLDAEAENFLGFVSTALTDRDDESIAFETLLTPEENTKVVAAQALLHVLTLGTKGMLRVRQEVGYGDIELSVLSGKRVTMFEGEASSEIDVDEASQLANDGGHDGQRDVEMADD